MTLSRTVRAGLCAALAVLMPMERAAAQAYPAQAVKLVVPFPAGSATDAIARLIGREWQDALGPDRMPAFIKAEVDKWAILVRQAGIQPE